MRTTVAAVLAALSIALLGATCDATPGSKEPFAEHTCAAPYPAGTPTAANVFCTDPGTMDAALPVKIIDGDTLDVLVGGADERVRLYGVDTPERGDPCFAEAAGRLRQLAGTELRLRKDARNRDRYGRLLRYVFLPNGTSVDALLIEEGLAVAWTQDGYARDALVALETAAKARHAGCLWE
jgi:endonuclease YncB( thermonuclease family)